MELVPDAAEQEWILQHLGELVRLQGARRFVSGTLVLPTSKFFPDRWRGDEASVRRQLARIMGYASLGELTFDLEVFDDDASATARTLHLEGVHHVGDTAAWFAGLENDETACFGVRRDQLGDPEGLVGILCHEVAHAYRARHDLVYADVDEDELLTDLTTVYLGFGVLTTNLTRRYRTRLDGSERRGGGYLSPVEMSFALAVQSVCRGGKLSEAKELAGHLEAAQEGCFLEARKLLEPSRARLVERLGLGDAAARPNEGQPVYRIKPGWLRASRCAGLDCGARLANTDVVCAHCGGVIAGDVRAAEEAARAEAAQAEEAGKSVLAALGLDKRRG